MKLEIIRSSVGVSLISGLRMVFAFLSQMAIAYYFGTSRELDIYLIASAMPLVVSGVVSALFSSSIIPILMNVRDDEREFLIALSSIFFYAIVICTVIGFTGLLFGKTLLSFTTSLYQNELSLAADLSKIIWGCIGIEGVISLFSCFYNFKKKFLFPSFLMLLPVIGMILGTIFFSKSMGIRGLAFGWMMMDVFSLLLIYSGSFRFLPRFTLRKIRSNNYFAISFLKSIIPIAISILPFTILPLIDSYWASSLEEGSMSYIGYSTRISLAIGSLVINGLYAVILPYLSEDVAKNNLCSFNANLQGSIKISFLIAIPVACAFYLYRDPLIASFLQRGKFTTLSTTGVVSLLPFYLAGSIMMFPSTLISRAFFAKQKSRSLSTISIVLICYYFVLSGLLVNKFSYIGIGVTYLTYWIFFFTASSLSLNNEILSKSLLIFTSKVLLNSLISTGLVFLVLEFVKISGLTKIALYIFFVIIIYAFSIKYILKVADLSRLIWNFPTSD